MVSEEIHLQSVTIVETLLEIDISPFRGILTDMSPIDSRLMAFEHRVGAFNVTAFNFPCGLDNDAIDASSNTDESVFRNVCW